MIHRLVAMALVSKLIGTVADFVERPGAPNLYWALTALPRPLIDLRGAEEWEYRMAEMQIPELGDLDRERTAEQWDGVLRRIRTDLRRLGTLGSERGNPNLPDWFPKDCDPGEPAAKSPELAAACKFVARSKGLPPEQVEAMPPAQVLLLNMLGTWQEDRDDYYRAIYLPYPQCLPVFEAASKRLRDAPSTEGRVLSRILLPALPNVTAQQARVESNVAALRVIEALSDVCRPTRRPLAGQPERRDRSFHSRRPQYRPAVPVQSPRRRGDAGQPSARRPAAQQRSALPRVHPQQVSHDPLSWHRERAACATPTLSIDVGWLPFPREGTGADAGASDSRLPER